MSYKSIAMFSADNFLIHPEYISHLHFKNIQVVLVILYFYIYALKFGVIFVLFFLLYVEEIVAHFVTRNTNRSISPILCISLYIQL